MENDAQNARATEVLKQRFAKAGVSVRDAVPAFSGMYPRFSGFGGWEVLFTRWRILALSDDEVHIWSAWTGPTPRKLLTSNALARLARDREQSGLSVVLVLVFAARTMLGDFTITLPDFFRILGGTEIPGATYIGATCASG